MNAERSATSPFCFHRTFFFPAVRGNREGIPTVRPWISFGFCPKRAPLFLVSSFPRLEEDSPTSFFVSVFFSWDLHFLFLFFPFPGCPPFSKPSHLVMGIVISRFYTLSFWPPLYFSLLSSSFTDPCEHFPCSRALFPFPPLLQLPILFQAFSPGPPRYSPSLKFALLLCLSDGSCNLIFLGHSYLCRSPHTPFPFFSKTFFPQLLSLPDNCSPMTSKMPLYCLPTVSW